MLETSEYIIGYKLLRAYTDWPSIDSLLSEKARIPMDLIPRKVLGLSVSGKQKESRNRIARVCDFVAS